MVVDNTLEDAETGVPLCPGNPSTAQKEVLERILLHNGSIKPDESYY